MNENKSQRETELDQLAGAADEVHENIMSALMGSMVFRILIPILDRIIKFLRWINRRKT